jgi:hypothetical protein
VSWLGSSSLVPGALAVLFVQSSISLEFLTWFYLTSMQVSLTGSYHGKVSYHLAGWLIACTWSIGTFSTCITPLCGNVIILGCTNSSSFSSVSSSSFMHLRLRYPLQLKYLSYVWRNSFSLPNPKGIHCR